MKLVPMHELRSSGQNPVIPPLSRHELSVVGQDGAPAAQLCADEAV